MARARSLTSLIADARSRADMVNSTFCTDPEFAEWINQSIADLYDQLVAARGHEYYAAAYPFTTTAGVDTYALPPDFYQLLGVDAMVGSDTLEVYPYQFAERNRYKIAGLWAPPQPAYYRIRGGNVHFIPAPSGAYQITIHYIPACQRLVDGGEAFDGINGWEEYVVVDAAAKALEKEESDTGRLQARKAELKARIAGLAGNRDAGHPEKVTDVLATEHPWWRH